MRKCNKCGYLNDDNATFCSQCGSNIVDNQETINNGQNNSVYETYKKTNEDVYKYTTTANKVSLKVFAIVIGILSIILIVVFFKEMGVFVFIFPVLFYAGLGIFYVKERIKHKVFYSVNDAINRGINKK